MEEQPPVWRVAVNKLHKLSQTADKGVVLQIVQKIVFMRNQSRFLIISLSMI